MCYDEGAWQAYLDGEVSPEEKKAMEGHLKNCLPCRRRFHEVKENAAFVTDRLALYARELVDGRERAGLPASDKRKGVIAVLKKYRKVVVAAAVMIGLVGSLSFGPVKGLAQEFLTLFRVERVETITIDPQQLQQMQEAFYQKVGRLDIENFGKVSSEGFGPGKSITVAQAEQEVDFPVVFPRYLPFQSAARSIELQPGGRVSFTLDVQKANSLIKALGGTALLPRELNGQTFTLVMSDSLSVNYRANEQSPQNYHYLNIIRTRSPEIKAPAGVDINDLRQALLSLPAIPEPVRRQLAAIEDWQGTLVIPDSDQRVKKVSINGTPGIYVSRNYSREQSGFILWQKDGILTIVDGNLSFKELQKVAASLR
ncbi:DUF4367 domain-containing protein [Desulfofundulus sp. TPOSR]|uniref:zf-HC2 domain-containing protein n=1 Tax=Desulfofundulus sp. TPOSR TaxID=2714340 RepID=UPI0014095F75|nr:zf-HC2 domain-containing protein [Desulfofundulus sp. TPOSR]NHM27252.1 DUF4367 domain-containing protein [Desulfofundulus sp. TPOSR]